MGTGVPRLACLRPAAWLNGAQHGPTSSTQDPRPLGGAKHRAFGRRGPTLVSISVPDVPLRIGQLLAPFPLNIWEEAQGLCLYIGLATPRVEAIWHPEIQQSSDLAIASGRKQLERLRQQR